ncbi:unnamed protein product [Sympodiomycopsis kandeliae]
MAPDHAQIAATSARKVYAPDSSPVSTDKAMRDVSGSRIGKAMGSHSSFGSNFTKNIQKASSRPQPSSSASLNGSSGLSLDRFKFNNGETSKPRVPENAQRRRSPIQIVDDSSDLSDAASDDSRPQKKRKFKRGKQPSPDPSPQKPSASSKALHSRPVSQNEDSPIKIESEARDSKLEMMIARLQAVFKGRATIEEVESVARSSQNAAEAMSKIEAKINQRTRDQRNGSGIADAISISSSRSSSVASTAPASSSIHRGGSSQHGSADSPLKKSAVAPVQLKRKISPEIISDDGYSSSGSDARYSKQEAAAIEWFNDVNEATLIETIGCSAPQARIIIRLRPFDSADDAERRLKSTKGVTAKLFTDYIEVLASFNEVDKVLKRCEQRGRRLEAACSPEAISRDPHHLKAKPQNMAEDVELKDYQLDGVNWLSLRYRNETSCILADDMGTGKTCQVIAFLCDLKSRGVKGTSLVVAPSSTIENWSREMVKFGPNLSCLVFAGDQAERREMRYEVEAEPNKYDVIVTSYNSATSATDLKFFKKFGFNACVYDEGHQLKNQNTNNYRNLMQVRAKWRLLLTGTPLQNNLLELMSLLKFIMPADFKHATEALETIFKGKSGARDSQLSKSRVDRAKGMMQPFVLRRIKDKVLSLPPKTIEIHYCDMTPHQEKIYKKLLDRTRLELLEQDEDASGNKSGTKRKKDQSSNILMRLRKAAIHPMMFRTIFTADKIAAMVKDYVKEPEHMDDNMQHLREDFAINSDAELSQLAGQFPHTRKHQVDGSAWLNSGKIKALDVWIKEIKARGEKLVIFSQFEMALFLLMSALDELDHRWIAFSGRTKVEERQSVIDEFQTNPDITVFLLTTKAGGVGVNLTSANWVIMLDQDFNPQNDKQAEDRCWRIGQEKEVHIIKLISKETIDEDILALGQQKLELAARVSGMENGAQGAIKNGDHQSAEGEAAAISSIDMDDGKQQDATAKTLMSKLRDRAQETGSTKEAKGAASRRGCNGVNDDDDDDDDVQILG